MSETNGVQQVKPGGLVQPGPLVSQVSAQDGMVVLRLECATGMHVYLFDPDHANQLGAFLQQHAQRAASGLTVAKNLTGLIPPKG